MTLVTKQFDRSVDGARVLFKHFLGKIQRTEGYVREFSPSGSHVRISKKPTKKDRGVWFECAELRLIEVLDTKFEIEEEPKKRGSDEEEDAA